MPSATHTTGPKSPAVVTFTQIDATSGFNCSRLNLYSRSCLQLHYTLRHSRRKLCRPAPAAVGPLGRAWCWPGRRLGSRAILCPVANTHGRRRTRRRRSKISRY